jgi:hypothetical protein
VAKTAAFLQEQSLAKESADEGIARYRSRSGHRANATSFSLPQGSGIA